MTWKVESVPIKSKENKVWFDQEFDINSKHVRIEKNLFRGESLKLEGSHTVSLDTIKADGRPHCVMVTLENKLVVASEEELTGEYLAHLAFIYPADETIRVLKFIPE